MNDKLIKIGHGDKELREGTKWPYDVYINLESPDKPITLCEGFGWGAAGGDFALQKVLIKHWDNHLEICECMPLKLIAEEEKKLNIISLHKKY